MPMRIVLRMKATDVAIAAATAGVSKNAAIAAVANDESQLIRYIKLTIRQKNSHKLYGQAAEV